MPFPASISIPVDTAGSLGFDTKLTARDQSFLLSVSWYAAMHGVTDDNTVDVPDAELRSALGGLKRPNIDEEVAHQLRLDGATIDSHTLPDIVGGVEAPTVDPGLKRAYIAGARRWIVIPELVDAFDTSEGATVSIPMTVLAKARSRFTIPTFMRAVAWASGAIPKKWVRRRDQQSTVFRIPVAELKSELGAETLAGPVDFYRSCLEPAATEISTITDMMIQFELVKAPSIRAAGGRVIAVDMMIAGVEKYRPTARTRKEPTNRWGGPVDQAGVTPIRVPLAAKRMTRIVAKDDIDVPF